MRTSRLTGLLTSLSVAAALPTNTNISDPTPASCRTIPGDLTWPSPSQWDVLNQTVAGNLIATEPIAAPCHGASYDAAKCDALRQGWYNVETHLPSSSSPMAYIFSNNTCNPFLPSDTPCTLGYLPTYVVNATSTADIQAALAFSKLHNIRLVIRNTGHDFLGKSTGAHALSIWTRHLKDISLISDYHDASYTGAALKVGAGVQVNEAYRFAHANNLLLTGGNCPTVGLAGGYIQGGGHGPLASKLGLAADHLLSAEVITADGEVVVASETSHPDLFWALRGGGGSSYGIVVSATIKAYPDTFVSTANFTLPITEANVEKVYTVLRTWLTGQSALVDAGVSANWLISPTAFTLFAAFAPDTRKEDLDALLRPALDQMDELDLQYEYVLKEFPTFLEAYEFIGFTWSVADLQMGGQLIPREVVESETDRLVHVIRDIASKTIFSGLSYNVAGGNEADAVAVNPAWRRALLNADVGVAINYTDWSATKEATDSLTNDFLPRIHELAPDGGAYLNEGDIDAADWQELFYGEHYEKLERIKAVYDPFDVFYAKTAVGSQRWEQGLDGRLCRTGA